MKTPLFNKLIIFMICCIRPLFGSAQCRYAVTCTQYATFSLHNNALFPALWLIIKRVFSCSPFNVQ